MHVLIGVVDVILCYVQLFSLTLHQCGDLLLDAQHVLHLVLYLHQLLRLRFDQLTLQQHILVHFHHLDPVLRLFIVGGIARVVG